ncbi:hypothetical protein K490DRAFT_57325 [Saccharata proteae CBS 121410]|uniref:Uncharacterized protein n=1 Tax=Saccharata proteae CBS 121410 TaxID=1314787 RepID=A0A9P4HUP9_9PEZI|nr:hypothetical protein K490DRAFT_57325 [Saccharata proteae CBS 121410]
MRPGTSSSSTSTSSSSLCIPVTSTTNTTAAPPRTRSPAIKPTPSTYCRSGIGGAGNYHKATSLVTHPHHLHPSNNNNYNYNSGNYYSYTTTAAPAPPARLPSPPQTFTTGIGGAGNIHPHTPRSVHDFADSIARSRAIERNTPTVYHFGIGGAGNRVSPSTCGHTTCGPSNTTTCAPCNPSAQIQVPEYSREPLPYGALDSLRRKISQTFGRGRVSLASRSDCGDEAEKSEGEGERGWGRRGVWRF